MAGDVIIETALARVHNSSEFKKLEGMLAGLAGHATPFEQHHRQKAMAAVKGLMRIAVYEALTEACNTLRVDLT